MTLIHIITLVIYRYLCSRDFVEADYGTDIKFPVTAAQHLSKRLCKSFLLRASIFSRTRKLYFWWRKTFLKTISDVDFFSSLHLLQISQTCGNSTNLSSFPSANSAVHLNLNAKQLLHNKAQVASHAHFNGVQLKFLVLGKRRQPTLPGDRELILHSIN